MKKQTLRTPVLIIGGGVTGTGLARDLALRGICSTLIERRDINAGASGSNHGLLHSGARYVSNDLESAQQCKMENERLKRLVPDLIDPTGGIFAAVAGDDENYIADFPGLCRKAGIRCRKMDIEEALALEPILSKSLIAAYEVDDASVDPFGLSLSNMADAIKRGASLMLHTRVTGFTINRGKIQSVQVINTKTSCETSIEAGYIVNAAGAWSGQIAAMAGIDLNITYSKGTLLVTHSRLSNRVINRLRSPSDGDIFVPGGTISLLGTTSVRLKSLDIIRPTVEEVDHIIDELSPLLPVLNTTRYIRAYAGVRPLITNQDLEDDRSASRGFALFDHADDNVENLVTITGGKLTTYRHMAEVAADLICQKMGITAPCATAETALTGKADQRATTPGQSPRAWMKRHTKDDVLLCECEMVSKKVVDEILNDATLKSEPVDLRSIGLRSRIGKGACQGSMCSIRVVAHLYHQEVLHGNEGPATLKDFLHDRWIGQHAVLWGSQLAQAELSEAVHCGLFDLEK
ncbi:anaerobic glycerol-3-phosphate dehydrogenase subunit A [bacterium]|nr:anaerobic glycerol-3-phosphate dehydrogenase subunit A [bacterium]